MAARLNEEAQGYQRRVVEQAEGDAARFRQVVSEYSKAPQVTRDRMYLETMQQVLSNTSKVLVDQKGGNNLLYLPLDKLIQMTNPNPNEAPKVVEAPPAPEPATNRSREAFRGRDREAR
jgi:membrane protease subunit HflK